MLLSGSLYISLAVSFLSALSQKYLCLMRFKCKVPKKTTYMSTF